MRTLQLCVFWAWIHDSDFRAGAPIGLSGGHVLGIGSTWLIIPSEDMGELLAEEYGQLTNNEWTCISWEWWEPSIEAVTMFKKKKKKTLPLLSISLTCWCCSTEFLSPVLCKSPCYPVLYTLTVNESVSPGSSSEMQSLRFWPRPTESWSAFSQDPQVVPMQMVGESLTYRLSFPLLSQFLYYTDNLVSHQPERIPLLQREGDVLSTTRLFGWAEGEDIRTFAC